MVHTIYCYACDSRAVYTISTTATNVKFLFLDQASINIGYMSTHSPEHTWIIAEFCWVIWIFLLVCLLIKTCTIIRLANKTRNKTEPEYCISSGPCQSSKTTGIYGLIRSCRLTNGQWTKHIVPNLLFKPYHVIYQAQKYLISLKALETEALQAQISGIWEHFDPRQIGRMHHSIDKCIKISYHRHKKEYNGRLCGTKSFYTDELVYLTTHPWAPLTADSFKHRFCLILEFRTTHRGRVIAVPKTL